MGDVLEGTFDARGTVLEMLDGPSWSREALEQLRTATARAKAMVDENPELAAAFIQSAAPSLGRKAWQAVGSGQMGNFLAIIAIAVGVLLAHSGAEPLSPQEIHQIVDTTISQYEDRPEDSLIRLRERDAEAQETFKGTSSHPVDREVEQGE